MLTVLTLVSRFRGRKMATGPIIKSSVDALTCPASKDREILWDGGHREAVRGFGVAAFRNGGKCYVAQYRKDGRSRRTRIGEHGRLTPEEARKQARIILGAVEGGADPIAAAQGRARSADVRSGRGRFHREPCHAEAQGTDGHEYERILNAHVVPTLGSKRIVDVRRADVAKCMRKLADVALSGEPGACACLGHLELGGPARRSGARRQPRPRNRTLSRRGRERYLTSEELARLGDALREGETIGLPYSVDETKPTAKHAPKADHRRAKLDPFAVAAIRLLILTGARLREILDAQWSQLDLERGVLFLADSKTGRKPLYLSAAAQAVLAAIPRVEGNPHIIAGALEGAPRADLNKPWRAVKQGANIEGVRIHDLRHSFASFGAGASLGLPSSASC